MGGTNSKKDDVKVEEIAPEKSFGFHLLEFHLQSMGMSLLSLIIMLGVILVVIVLYRKFAKAGKHGHGHGRGHHGRRRCSCDSLEGARAHSPRREESSMQPLLQLLQLQQLQHAQVPPVRFSHLSSLVRPQPRYDDRFTVIDEEPRAARPVVRPAAAVVRPAAAEEVGLQDC